MTVFVRNKLVQGGKTTGYTVNTDGKESVYSVRDAVHLLRGIIFSEGGRFCGLHAYAQKHTCR